MDPSLPHREISLTSISRNALFRPMSVPPPVNPPLQHALSRLQKHVPKSDGVNGQSPVFIPSAKEQKPLGEILSSAGRRALGGGIPGMSAMAIQVLSLMWLRTTVNYQYRYGTGTITALRTLYSQGGVRRFYRGVGPALIQGPLSRFGDTAANTGMLALLDSYESTAGLPIGVKTGSASLAAAGWRIFLMPVDTCKTILQVSTF